MKITLSITKSYATLAVQHGLKNGESITSKKKFLQAVIDYMEAYGEICIDDHESEYRSYLDQAVSIVNKYYKP